MASPIRNCVTYLPLFFWFYKDYNSECLLATFKKFSNCGFGEICGKRLTTSAYMDLISM